MGRRPVWSPPPLWGRVRVGGGQSVARETTPRRAPLGIGPPRTAFARTCPAQEIRLDVTRDTWLSNVGPEADGSNGASPRLKAKSIQEMSLIDVDPARAQGPRHRLGHAPPEERR